MLVKFIVPCLLLCWVYCSLKGTIGCGYQGWFTAGQDGSKNGWTHYKMASSKPFAKDNCVFDIWPYTHEYEKVYPVAQFGNVFALPSPFDYSTVQTQFKWFKEYHIDVIYHQRFGSDIRNKGSNIYKFKNQVLENVERAAGEQGREWVLMYDISGMKEGEIKSVIMDDWKFLNQQYQIRSKPQYATHNDKPVVVVWGIGFTDNHRQYTLEQCDELVQYLLNGEYGNNTVMLGLPTYWRNGGRDAPTGQRLQYLHKIIAKTHIVSPWLVGRVRDLNGAEIYAKIMLKDDMEWCKQRNIDFMPVIYPGFSWHNLQASGENPQHPGPYDEIPRKQNSQYFLQKQGTEYMKAGSEMLYVAMCDEINQGTAIFKFSKTTPYLSDGLRFITFDEEEDFYLHLTGKIGDKLKQNVQKKVSQS